MTASSQHSIADIAGALRDNADGAALLFDVDGVLAPIVPHAGDARVPNEVLDVLARLCDRYLVVGLVSGRALADVDRMVPVPGLTRGGNHGLEVALPSGDAEVVPEAQPHARAMRAFVAAHPPSVLGPHGVWLEDKGVSVSLHHREAPDQAGAEAFLAGPVAGAAVSAGLRVRHGRMVVEVLPDVDVDKGTVVRQIIQVCGARTALYVGDDRTDMDAWRALHDLQTIGVLDHAHCVVADQPEVESAVRAAADVAVSGTGGVLRLLHQLAS